MNPLFLQLALHMMAAGSSQPSLLALLGGAAGPKGAPAAPPAASGGITPDQLPMLMSQLAPLLSAGPKMMMAPAMAPTPTMYHPAAPLMSPFYSGGGQ